MGFNSGFKGLMLSEMRTGAISWGAKVAGA